MDFLTLTRGKVEVTSYISNPVIFKVSLNTYYSDIKEQSNSSRYIILGKLLAVITDRFIFSWSSKLFYMAYIAIKSNQITNSILRNSSSLNKKYNSEATMKLKYFFICNRASQLYLIFVFCHIFCCLVK